MQERRQELDTRARELDIRESLIKAAEKRMEGQLAEIKETEARIKVATQQKDDAQAARFKGLVTMYENMKPRDAAKIFDRLEIGVLLEVASKIEPRKMADIMAQMSPDTAAAPDRRARQPERRTASPTAAVRRPACRKSRANRPHNKFFIRRGLAAPPCEALRDAVIRRMGLKPAPTKFARGRIR